MSIACPNHEKSERERERAVTFLFGGGACFEFYKKKKIEKKKKSTRCLYMDPHTYPTTFTVNPKVVRKSSPAQKSMNSHSQPSLFKSFLTLGGLGLRLHWLLFFSFLFFLLIFGRYKWALHVQWEFFFFFNFCN